MWYNVNIPGGPKKNGSVYSYIWEVYGTLILIKFGMLVDTNLKIKYTKGFEEICNSFEMVAN